MARSPILRPDPGEYDPYYESYIALVPEGDVLAFLEQQQGEMLELLTGFGEERADHRYAPGKWSVKEVVGHVADCERVFAYRALRFARGDAGPLAGLDQDPWVVAGRFDRRSLTDLAAELGSVCDASLSLFRSFDEETAVRRGVANDCEVSVRALVWIIAGHASHHSKILRERYA